MNADENLVEVIARAIQVEAERFYNPVNLYVEGEAARRYEKSNPGSDYYCDQPPDPEYLRDWSILAQSVFVALREAGYTVTRSGNGGVEQRFDKLQNVTFRSNGRGIFHERAEFVDRQEASTAGAKQGKEDGK